MDITMFDYYLERKRINTFDKLTKDEFLDYLDEFLNLNDEEY